MVLAGVVDDLLQLNKAVISSNAAMIFLKYMLVEFEKFPVSLITGDVVKKRRETNLSVSHARPRAFTSNKQPHALTWLQ